MKKLFSLSIFLLIVFTVSCVNPNVFTEEDILFCEPTFDMTYRDIIPIDAIRVPHSETRGNHHNFISPCKQTDTNPLIFTRSSIRTHQVIFVFDAIYPLDAMLFTSYEGDNAQTISSISIDVSINDQNYQRVIQSMIIDQTQTEIQLGGTMAKSVRITFQADDNAYGIQDVKFRLDEGYIIKEDHAWSETFLRYQGWTGADGIFSFNLTNGDRSIGAYVEHTAFIFSDTFIGTVFEHNKVRGQARMINNSLGYYDHQKAFNEAFDFDYLLSNGLAQSVFEPDAYTGKRARNLLDGDGLSLTHSKDAKLTNLDNGIMWLSSDLDATLIIDLKANYQMQSLVIWNYNETPEYGVKQMRISHSQDGENYVLSNTYHIKKASGLADVPYSKEIEFNETARYIKLEVIESHHEDFVGLGKIMIFDQEGLQLFGEISATSEITTPTSIDRTSRLWLQDGIVIQDKLYVFPILVKDFQNFFKVHNVGLMEIPIIGHRLDHAKTRYHNTPLQMRTDDGGELFFGAGVLNNVGIDGYIYIYGYKDLNGRHLVVARTRLDTFTNFNEWTFYDGHTFQKDPTKVEKQIQGVSPELSVTYIPSGIHEGKYMLISIENSISGRVVYSISDSPYGPFEPFTLIYQAMEGTYLNGAFAYNAKMHPHLSEPGNYLISYNVNTTNLGALNDARIYYPRFIRMIEVKNKGA